MRGFTEDEVLPFAQFAREHPYEVRFIEFMPLDADHNWTPDSVLSGDEIRAIIERAWPLEPEPREPHATARVYRFADGNGAIGFINPVSEPFCGDCNRIRLTADGQLRTCLFSLNETDLRAPLRDGRRRRRARADRPRRGVAQGAQAPRQRAGLRPAAAHDERHRRLSASGRQRPLSSAAACRMSSGWLTLKNGSSSGQSTIRGLRAATTSVTGASKSARRAR